MISRLKILFLLCLFWRNNPQRAMASSFMRFLDHTKRHTTVCRTPLDERSARRRNLYLTTHNTHNSQTSMPPVGFEPTISAGERPQTYALDRVASGTSEILFSVSNFGFKQSARNLFGIRRDQFRKCYVFVLSYLYKNYRDIACYLLFTYSLHGAESFLRS